MQEKVVRNEQRWSMRSGTINQDAGSLALPRGQNRELLVPKRKFVDERRRGVVAAGADGEGVGYDG